jgi:hypothetical protein
MRPLAALVTLHVSGGLSSEGGIVASALPEIPVGEGEVVAFHHVIHVDAGGVVAGDGEADSVGSVTLRESRAFTARIAEVAAERFRPRAVDAALSGPRIAERK